MTRTPQRTFVVEYKTNRRQVQARPPSIWGNLDLQAVARQIEADGILPDAGRSAPSATVNDPAAVATSISSLEAQVAFEDHLQGPAFPILHDGNGAPLQSLPDELLAIEAPAAPEPQRRRTAGGANSSNGTSGPNRSASIRQWTAPDDCCETLGRTGDEEGLIALDAENRRLKRLVMLKLRRENETLRLMLCRFGLA